MEAMGRWYRGMTEHSVSTAVDLVIIPKTYWVGIWNSPAFDKRGERYEKIKIYGRSDPCGFAAGEDGVSVGAFCRV